MGFLWEVGSVWVYLLWFVVLVLQMAIAEINRRWLWTVFAFWTVGASLLIPYVIQHGVPAVGWFPFGKYLIMIATATLNGVMVALAIKYPRQAHRWAFWMGVIVWVGLAANIMEANIRDITIYLENGIYQDCAASVSCLQGIDASRSISMFEGLPESRGITAPVQSTAWYQALSDNFQARGIGIDPATGFRTIGGYWNLLTAAAGVLNIITISGIGKVIITSKGKQKVRGLVIADMCWPWIVAYDLWNHAFLYNSLADYTWYCTFALLLACTIPAFTWAKGQWLWFRCYTLMFWIAANNILPQLLVKPSIMTNYSTMNPVANQVCAWAALLANLAVFAYWCYRAYVMRSNPVLGCIFIRTKAFREVVRLHADEKDKYFLADMVEQTPTELGFSPDSPTPPKDGYVGWMPWWKRDRRYPKLRTPLAADPYLVQKGVETDPQWDV